MDTKNKEVANYIRYGRILANKSHAKETAIILVLGMIMTLVVGGCIATVWPKPGTFATVVGVALILPRVVAAVRNYKLAKAEYDEFIEATRQPWENSPAK